MANSIPCSGTGKSFWHAQRTAEDHFDQLAVPELDHHIAVNVQHNPLPCTARTDQVVPAVVLTPHSRTTAAWPRTSIRAELAQLPPQVPAVQCAMLRCNVTRTCTRLHWGLPGMKAASVRPVTRMRAHAGTDMGPACFTKVRQDRRWTPCQHVHDGEGHHCNVLSPCRATMSMVGAPPASRPSVSRCSEGKPSQTAG